MNRQRASVQMRLSCIPACALMIPPLCFAGCARPTSLAHVRQSSAAPTRPADAMQVARSSGGGASAQKGPTELVIGHSARGIPIRLVRFGEGIGGLLVFGGIHGNEQNSSELAARLLSELRNDPSAGRAMPIAVIAAMNPDGLADRTRGNANGVDLNRNFPATNWRPAASGRRHGVSAASEPETRALLHAMDLLRPRAVISIHATHGRVCNNFDGDGRRLAELLSRHNGYPVTASIGYPTPGSFGSWAGVDRALSIVTLELPRNLSGEQCWIANGAGLLAACREHPATHNSNM